MSRKIITCFLIIPVVLFINALVNPGEAWSSNSTVGEMLFLVFSLPILVINYLVWFGDTQNHA